MTYILSQFNETLADALMHAYFNDSELSRLLGFGMDVKLDAISSAALPLKARIEQVLQWAAGEGRLDELFVKAIERKPNNPLLRDFAKTLVGSVKDEHEKLVRAIEPFVNKEYENPDAEKIRGVLQAYKTSGALEALVSNAGALQSAQNTEDWEKGWHCSRRRVCSIGLGDVSIGTGFLVGPDRVMTNAHVIATSAQATDFTAVFDYEGKTKRASLAKIAVAESLVHSDPRDYDFRILRLAEVPSGNRGYFKATLRHLEFRDAVSVLGHSGGQPMTMAFGVVFDRNSYMRRVAYSAATAPGSSGSPVFADDWSLVALHHHGEKNVNNHGIPMTAIHEHLKTVGRADLLETDAAK